MNKSIKVAFYKVEIFSSKNQKSLKLYSFEELMKELTTILDGEDNNQIIESKNGLETSIWFDYLNYFEKFNLQDCKRIYFLLAKDVKSLMEEDKKNKKLKHKETFESDNHLKIPSHFVYFLDKQILGVEEMNNAPTKSAISRIMQDKLNVKISFKPINRDDLIERIKLFQEAIESVEFDIQDFSKLIKNAEPDKFLEFLNKNESHIKIKTKLISNENKKFAIDLFSKLLYKLNNKNNIESEILKEINNMKIHFKNEHSKQELIELFNNFLVFKADRKLAYEDLSEIEDEIEKRIKYSKSVYETIIGFYNEYFK